MIESFIDRLVHQGSITIEVTPPRSCTLDTILSTIDTHLSTLDFDGFSVTDNPLAKLKFSAIVTAQVLQERYKKPAITTMSMRDKNIIALQSDLLGMNYCNLRTVLALTGDPAKLSDQPDAKGVFEGDSTKLLRTIACFNAGIDYAGKPFTTKPKPVYPFAVSNSYAKNFSHIQKKWHKKIEAGAKAIITQPIFDEEIAKKLLSLFEETRSSFNDERSQVQLIFGFFPITRLRTAQFLSSHVPGIYVPQEWINDLLNASHEEEETRIGFERSRNLLHILYRLNPRIHIMTANKFDLASQLIRSLKS